MKKNIPIITDPTRIKRYSQQFCTFVDKDLVNELTSGMYALSSLVAVAKDWNLFVEFCHTKSVQPLPASTTAVRLYIEKVSLERKYSSIKRYAVTISLIHKVLGYADPVKNSRVQTALGDIRINKKGDQQSTQAFRREHLETLTGSLQTSSSVKDWRDLAIYHVMYEGLLKRSELRDFGLKQIIENEDSLAIVVGNEEITLSSTASLVLLRWLNVRGSLGDYVFTAIDRHGNIGFDPLNDSSIYRILRNASDLLGLDYTFSGQSLRVGAAQELAEQGVKIRDIQYAGRWLSPAMPYQYIGNVAKAELEKMRYLSFKFID
ncbi:tyrosine-type recombinase/integrase [Vibrio sp. 404]|uniref:Tyrosine-type recombinase/integrase n=1 Tax=Vibrio marinisediminis TaxID=2758441 RepID=A0A7W2FS80_9VIBR|nr:tyrosine-type recombinase/integrase [Vibrio marinisediminis]MBA5763288.1 tyrosine-type recombinase/integrase [Vibrio marinisediminis]